jgi:hypothetical protein
VPSEWVVAGTGDFNGDGKTDLLWRHNTAGTVAIWLLNGLQVAQSGGLGSVPNDWFITESGDFNGDGKSDILWRNLSGTIALWFLNGLQVSCRGSSARWGSNGRSRWRTQIDDSQRVRSGDSAHAAADPAPPQCRSHRSGDADGSARAPSMARGRSRSGVPARELRSSWLDARLTPP